MGVIFSLMWKTAYSLSSKSENIYIFFNSRRPDSHVSILPHSTMLFFPLKYHCFVFSTCLNYSEEEEIIGMEFKCKYVFVENLLNGKEE